MIRTGHVHGLAGDDMPADWPPLTADELSRLLARHPALGAVQAIAWNSPRPLSAAALVETRGERVFIKRHHQRVRSATTLAEEHAFAAWLRERGVPVPRVLADADGYTATTLGEWVYEVQAPAHGIDVYRDTVSWVPPMVPGHAHAAGGMLARLRAAAADYAAPQRSTHVLVARSELLAADDPVSALAAQLPDRCGLAAYLATRDWRHELAAAIAPFHAAVHARVRAQPRCWTHGDWHVSNLCWSGIGADARISDVLDFGLAARTFALFDLATAIERNAIAWLEGPDDRARPRIAQALIDGYRDVQPLDRDALAFVADLLPVVHLDFALSEVEYFSAITGSRAHADVAWDAFLRGHAAWFRTAPGRQLLAAIRAA